MGTGCAGANTMADQGFPVREAPTPLGGRQPPTRVLFAKMYAETKESGPAEGGACRRIPGSATGLIVPRDDMTVFHKSNLAGRQLIRCTS